MAFTFTSDTLPADHKAAIRQMKQQLRAQLGDVQLIFNQRAMPLPPAWRKSTLSKRKAPRYGLCCPMRILKRVA